MELIVTWNKRAKFNYLNILVYIVNEFGDAAGHNYFDRVNRTITLLKPFPELGILWNKLP